VVLRWFEELPRVEPGHDIDMLVDDEHVELVQRLLADRPPRKGGQHVDVYSVSGLPGSDLDGIPCFPPRFAQAMLDTAVWLRDAYRIPNPRYHFLGLAYHAAYHKGYASGLRTDSGADEVRRSASHDYETVLTDLATRLGESMVPTLDGVDRYLAAQDLRPPLDALNRLARSNPWIEEHFLRKLPDVDPVWRGLTVFVIRERAEPLLEVATRELDRAGFEILEVVPLDDAQRAAAQASVRGGNWTQGPWPVSGGGPSVFIVAYDVAPKFAAGAGIGAVDVRTAVAKEGVREAMQRGVEAGRRYNPLHSSDDAHQAVDYLEALQDPEMMARLRRSAQDLVDACAVPFPVVRFLAPENPQRRARVALVDHPVHGLSVCKVFRPGAARFYERELRARTELRDLPEIPDLLDHGKNWLLTSLYQDDGRHVLRRLRYRGLVQLRPEASRALAMFARSLHERGLFLLDLTTHNLVSDPVNGLRVLDLEFIQEYKGSVPDLAAAYTVRGVAAEGLSAGGGNYDVPVDDGFGNSLFHPAITGLTLSDLLGPERISTTVRRSATQLGWYAVLEAVHFRRLALRNLRRSELGRALGVLKARLRPRR
jgi:hypothetical protein